MVVFVCLCSHEARGFTGNKSTSSGMHKTRKVDSDSRSRVGKRYLNSLRLQNEGICADQMHR